jgi:hypothetical protein
MPPMRPTPPPKGALISLMFDRFAPFVQDACMWDVLGFRPSNAAGARLVIHRCVLASRYNKLEGENFQEV